MNVSTYPTRQFLRLFPSARRLATEDLQRLLSLLITIQVPEGAVLFAAGEDPDAAFLLAAGGVRAVREVETGRTVTLARLGRGDVVGDMGLIDGTPREATAVVESELTALRLDVSAYRLLKQEHHAAAAWLLEEIDRRLAERIHQMFDRVARIREEPELAAAIPVVEPPHRPWYARLWTRDVR